MWFLTRVECSKPFPLLREFPSAIAVVVKTKKDTILRVVDQGYTPVVPLGTRVIPLPERIPVQDELGTPFLPKWQWFLCVGSDGKFQALVDLRPDWTTES